MPGGSTWNAVLSSALYVQRNQVHALRHVAVTEQVLSDGSGEETVESFRTTITHARQQRVNAGDPDGGQWTHVRHKRSLKTLLGQRTFKQSCSCTCDNLLYLEITN